MAEHVPVLPRGRLTHTADVTRVLVGATLRSFAAGFGSKFLRIAAQGLMILAEAVAAVMLLDRFGSIAGWSTPEVLVLVGLSNVGLGLGMVVGDPFEPPVFSQLLRDGAFDAVLTRPVSPWLWVSVSDLQVRHFGRVITGSLITLGAVAATDAPLAGWTMPLLVGSGIGMGITVAAILTIGAAITMYTIEGTEVLNAFTYGGASMSGWPLDIYASAMRAIFVWLVPVGAVVYLPTIHVLGRPGTDGATAGMLWLVPLLVLAFTGVAALAWQVGLRRFRATGA